MPESSPPIPIDYTSRDYQAVRADLVAGIPDWLPEWTNRTESDFGIILIEMFAYVGDILGYYIDRAANEAFISTAVQRSSVLAHAATLDYRPTGLTAATVDLTLTISDDAAGNVTIDAGSQFSTQAVAGTDPIVFETDEDITIGVGASDTVAATQGVSVSEPEASPVGISSGAADQVFPLFYPDIIENSLTLYVDEDGAGGSPTQAWTFIENIIDASAEDRVYSTTTDADGITYVRFGDDVNGRIPTAGAIITADYRTGAGEDGNVGSGTIIEIVTPIVGLDTVTNSAAASGGSDAESVASIRRQAPRSLGTLNRAVTLADYAVLAEKVSGVLHAQATASVYTSVTLYVAPNGGGAPSTALKNSVENDLADKKMATVSITTADPTYVPIDVTVNPVNVLPQYDRGAVETAVSNAITALFDVENVDFADRVTQSEVYQAIQAVEGVDYAVITELNDDGLGGLGDVQTADGEIPSAGTIDVTATGGLVGT